MTSNTFFKVNNIWRIFKNYVDIGQGNVNDPEGHRLYHLGDISIVLSNEIIPFPRGSSHIQTAGRVIVSSSAAKSIIYSNCQNDHQICKWQIGQFIFKCQEGNYIFKLSRGPSCIQKAKGEISSSNAKRAITYLNLREDHYIFKFQEENYIFKPSVGHHVFKIPRWTLHLLMPTGTLH